MVVVAVVAVVGTLELYLGGIELTVFFFVTGHLKQGIQLRTGLKVFQCIFREEKQNCIFVFIFF